MGGVGKTQLAAVFARDLLATWVGLVVWVAAASRAGILSAYAEAADRLGLGIDVGDPERAAHRFLSWLATTPTRWAVVLDEVRDAEHVRELWPPDGGAGCTVVTTRRRDAGLLAGRNLVDVEVFTPVEAHAYLTERLSAGLADDVPGVGEDLGYLPLALSHAAAYLLDLELPCSTYRARFADRLRRLPTLFPGSMTVATTWSLSIEQADMGVVK